MKKLLALALPACFLLGCASDVAEETPSTDGITKTAREEPGTVDKTLPVPKSEDLEAGLSDYDYLNKYIGKPGKKKLEKQHVWSQTFGEDITYDMINGVESNGYHYRITFAGYEKEEVVKYVEWFNRSEDMSWDNGKTVYGPKDANALGCSYRVEKDKEGNYYMDCVCVC